MLISDIKPYERNARHNDKAIPKVAESIRKFGLRGSIVAVSAIGVKGDPERERLWHAGMDEAIARVRPKRVLLYGGTLGHDMHGIETIAYANAVTDRMAGDKPP